jgi:serine/threonine protein kinase
MLNHPHIVRFYELVQDVEPPFLVMDYVEGQSLTQLLEARQGEPLSLAQVARIIYQIGGALHLAHQQGIYHRDVKPSNVLIDRNDKAYLVDFGIALLVDRTRLTTGEMPCTPIYAAPEQWMEEPVDARTDVYALGVLLYELLTGHPPFAGRFPALIRQILEERPTEPSQWNSDIPPRVERVILKALAKAKDDRYPDAATMCDALRAAQEASAYDSVPQQEQPLSFYRIQCRQPGVACTTFLWTQRPTVAVPGRRRGSDVAGTPAWTGSWPVAAVVERTVNSHTYHGHRCCLSRPVHPYQHRNACATHSDPYPYSHTHANSLAHGCANVNEVSYAILDTDPDAIAHINTYALLDGE